MATTEAERAANLQNAQDKAGQLFIEIERDLIRPGVSEKTLNTEIYDLGFKRYGIKTHWHKRVIRSGPNTLCPFSDNPPDRIIEADDILIVDLGPVFEAWEADFGRTYVLGNDPHKIKLRDSLQPIWEIVKAKYNENPDMSGEELYDIASGVAGEYGFDFGADIAGHLVGSFPHERIPKDRTTLYITKGNNETMNTLGKDGFKRHWILEIHLRNTELGFGGFTEQLLTIG
ncbi:hypothetical protein N7486_000030 [Penicillium sp. IBT 16267x]|nr:hypothetical protein N7486_000030 [Penicillium sp. IBT 16267x]